MATLILKTSTSFFEQGNMCLAEYSQVNNWSLEAIEQYAVKSWPHNHMTRYFFDDNSAIDYVNADGRIYLAIVP